MRVGGGDHAADRGGDLTAVDGHLQAVVLRLRRVAGGGQLLPRAIDAAGRGVDLVLQVHALFLGRGLGAGVLQLLELLLGLLELLLTLAELGILACLLGSKFLLFLAGVDVGQHLLRRDAVADGGLDAGDRAGQLRGERGFAVGGDITRAGQGGGEVLLFHLRQIGRGQCGGIRTAAAAAAEGEGGKRSEEDECEQDRADDPPDLFTLRTLFYGASGVDSHGEEAPCCRQCIQCL